ncbi:MAG: Mov34/MPN/PAD-1 family protein [Verrucomicrobia bacterium]|nr:Mov34/MPN/PAD-1 family protein [Verrucomicrobiota bacterium]
MIAHADTVYTVWTNSHGAVDAICGNGELLGLRPAEFEVINWFDPADFICRLMLEAVEAAPLVPSKYLMQIGNDLPAALRCIPREAQHAHPHEACGLLVLTTQGLVSITARNLAPKNEAGVQEDFILDPAKFAYADEAGQILAIWHTHPSTPAAPSPADLQRSHDLQIPYLIYSLPTDGWHLHKPPPEDQPAVALIGRPWMHGVLDCYTLVRDWYRTRGLVFPQFAREDDWWAKGENLYLEHVGPHGFVRVGEGTERAALLRQLQPGDLLLYTLANSPVPQHAAIYEGDGCIVHHPEGRLSCREPFAGPRGFWIDRLHSVWRHPALPAAKGSEVAA